MVTISPTTPADTDSIAEILGAAFASDPVWRAIFLNVPDPRPRIAAAYRRDIKRHPDWVDTARDEAGTVLGALLWEPPLEGLGSQTVLSRLGATVALPLISLFSSTARRARLHDRAVDEFRPAEPHWYLHDIATSPQARGQGVGKALLQHRLDIVDLDPMPVFLESTTPASRRLYEHFGFEAQGTIESLPDTSSTPMVRHA